VDRTHSEIDGFADALAALLHGDFSRLEPLFTSADPKGGKSQILKWVDDGLFEDHAQALAEAFTCACFLGCTELARSLLGRGVNPAAGDKTGLDAIHWAVNRGQLETVRFLLQNKVPLETRNMYGTTVLGTAVWSALNEPRREHLQIIEQLLGAGARVDGIEFPTGSEYIDAVLRKHGARQH
jgi:ankyrin repeat protein